MSSKRTHAHFNSYKSLTPRTDPVTSALGTVLNKRKITTQAYHSGTFVGGHCPKYLQPNIKSVLTKTIIKQTQTLTNIPHRRSTYNVDIIQQSQ